MDVQHVPGRINVIADRLSCWWEGQAPQEGEGDGWTVSLDRDKTVGLTNDILLTHDSGSNEQIDALKA
jgi:hypothetical protein